MRMSWTPITTTRGKSIPAPCRKFLQLWKLLLLAGDVESVSLAIFVTLPIRERFPSQGGPGTTRGHLYRVLELLACVFSVSIKTFPPMLACFACSRGSRGSNSILAAKREKSFVGADLHSIMDDHGMLNPLVSRQLSVMAHYSVRSQSGSVMITPEQANAPFKLLRLIGRGGFGNVYLGEWAEQGRVAIKVRAVTTVHVCVHACGTHTHTYTQAPLMCAYLHTHTRARARTHTHTHTHGCTQTVAHTCAHTAPPPPPVHACSVRHMCTHAART